MKPAVLTNRGSGDFISSSRWLDVLLQHCGIAADDRLFFVMDSLKLGKEALAAQLDLLNRYRMEGNATVVERVVRAYVASKLK